MVELERKLSWNRLSCAHNFPIFSYFHKTFDKHLQKGLVYLYNKKDSVTAFTFLELQGIF